MFAGTIYAREWLFMEECGHPMVFRGLSDCLHNKLISIGSDVFL